MRRASVMVAAWVTLLWGGTALAAQTAQEKCDRSRVTASGTENPRRFGMKNISTVVIFLLAAIVASAGTPRISKAILTKNCLTGTDPSVAGDAAAITALRRTIDSACQCDHYSGAKGRTHGDYMTCVADIIRGTTAIRQQCKATVTKFYSQSTCGRNPTVHAQPCIKTATGTGKVTCAIKPTTKADGATPTNRCENGKSFNQIACPYLTTCLDAADTDQNLIIAAPGDSGACAPCGTPGLACCMSPPFGLTCTEGLCSSGRCAACGGVDEPCCPFGQTECASPATACSYPTATCVECGNAGEPCCSDLQSACVDATLVCLTVPLDAGSTCQPCGNAGEPCCSDSASVCASANLACAPADLNSPQLLLCEPCGEFGESCCANSTCNDGSSCTDLLPGIQLCS